MKKILILGTITFNHLNDEFNHLFDNPSKPNALIHKITSFVANQNVNYLEGIGEGSGQDYVIVNSFDGEIACATPELRKFFDDAVQHFEKEI